MTEGSLRNVVVVEPVVVPEHRVQVGAGVEVRRPQDFSDSAVEALHQPVGLGMARRREPVLDAVFRAELKTCFPEGCRPFWVNRSVKAWSLSVSRMRR